MVVLEKLQIRGIRSFNPNTANSIDFKSPLTLIVGPNGTGKTTIIECLKYATTGSMPPNSKNGAFIYDPKIAREVEVKAQVKLKFYNTKNQIMVCTRSLQLTQKKSKLEMKTLENLLWSINKNGEQISISGRCVEIDTEMPYHLGTSDSILENVIFCHQEESGWPLGEPKVIKKKMDDIFASTKYIKLIDSLKGLKRDESASLKLKRQEVVFINEQLHKRNLLTGNMDESRKKMNRLDEDNKFLEMQISDINKVIGDLNQQIRELEMIEKEQYMKKVEIESLRIYVKNFCFPILRDYEMKEIQNYDLETIQVDVITSKFHLDRVEHAYNEKKRENDEFSMLHKRIEVINKKIQDTSAKKSQLETKFSTEYIEKLRLISISVSSPDDIDIGAVKRYGENEIKEFEDKIANIKTETNLVYEKIKELIEEKASNEAHINFIEEIPGIKEPFDQNLLIESDGIEIQLNKNDKEIFEMQNQVAANEDLLKNERAQLCNVYLKFEERLTNTYNLKRYSELKTELMGKYKDSFDGDMIDLAEMKSNLLKLKDEIKFTKNKLKFEEENNIEKLYMKKQAEETFVVLSREIDEKIQRVGKLNCDFEMLTGVDYEDLEDVENLRNELETVKTSIAELSNAHLIYKNLQKMGVKNNDCPICKKILLSEEKMGFVKRLENVIIAIPDKLKAFEEKKSKLENLIKNSENLNKAKTEKNKEINEIRRIRIQIDDQKKIIAISDTYYCSESLEIEIIEKEELFETMKTDLNNATEYINLYKTKGSCETTDGPTIDELKDRILVLEYENSCKTERMNEISRENKILNLKINMINDYKKNLDKIKALGNFKNKNLDIKSRLNNFEDRIFAIEEISDDLQEKRNKSWEYYSDIVRVLENMQVEHINMKEEIINLEENLEELKDVNFNLDVNELINLKEKLDKTRKEFENLVVESENKQNKIQTYEENLVYQKNKSKLEFLLGIMKESHIDDLPVVRTKNIGVDRKRQLLENNRAMNRGEQIQLHDNYIRMEKEFNEFYKDSEEKHLKISSEVEIHETSLNDIENAIRTIDKSIVEFHSKKLNEINSILKDLWIKTYKGNDIDYIEIQAEVAESKSYNYKVMMIKSGVELEMRGRSSSGQKVIASILIRLALSDSFGSKCSILALDEPTTNLDSENIESLAETLSSLIESRKSDIDFQLIIITHDEQFLNLLCHRNCEEYFRLRRNTKGDSIIEKHLV